MSLKPCVNLTTLLIFYDFFLTFLPNVYPGLLSAKLVRGFLCSLGEVERSFIVPFGPDVLVTGKLAAVEKKRDSGAETDKEKGGSGGLK